MIDFKMIWRTHPIITLLIGCLMVASALTISSHSIAPSVSSYEEVSFFTAQTWAQCKWFCLSLIVYFLVACIDYHHLREWTWIFYSVAIAMLIGVFFTEPIANVHRWYRIPGLGMSLQPSEYAKIAMIISLSWYLERSKQSSAEASVLFLSGIIALLPFALILKQPDLGSALVIYPIVMGMFYFGGVYPPAQRLMRWTGILALAGVLAIFLGLISHENLKPYALKFIREYQYDRLNPGGYHNLAGQTSIAIGSWWGKGWRQSSYSNQGFLPEPYTDSIFASFAEEFGLIGMIGLLFIYFSLFAYGFRVAYSTKDTFGQLLAAGLSLYLIMHAIINIAMMIGLFPITGVPLPLMSYGGSSSLSAAIALGIIQSIWARRFTF
jgi:rod shape determining protein RodA